MPDDLAAIPEPDELQSAAEEPEGSAAGEEPEGEEEEAGGEPEGEAGEQDAAAADEIPSDEEILRAEIDLLKSQAKHFEAIAGRNQGELGQLRRTNEELLQRMQQPMQPARPETEDYPEYEPAPQQQRRAPQAPPATDPRTIYLVKSALAEGWNQFQNSPGAQDIVQQDEAGNRSFTEDFQRALAPQADTINRLFLADDPSWVQDEFVRILQTAQLKVEKDRKLARLQELQRRKASQVDELKKRKRVSSASSTGSARAEPRKKQLDPYKLPLHEMKKRIDEGRFT